MNTPLRVAQLVCTSDFAGVERYVANLSNGLMEAGCQVTVLGGEPQRMVRELSGRQKAYWPASTVPKAVARLGRLGRFDIVHAHMTSAELAAGAARVVNRGRFLTTRHFAARRGAHPAGRLAAMAIRPLVDLQLAISDYVAARIDGASVVVHPGVPPQASLPAGGRRPIVLVAQRLEEEKQTDVALRAWERSGLAGAGWELHLVGGGAQEEALRNLARDLGVADSCRFLGLRDDLSRRYTEASIFLAPTPDEGFGLAVVEAMAAGLPVLASRSGGHLETVGPCPGAALFTPGDIAEASLLLRALADDEDRRQRYGQQLQALQRQKFDSFTQAKQVAALYRSLDRSDP